MLDRASSTQWLETGASRDSEDKSYNISHKSLLSHLKPNRLPSIYQATVVEVGGNKGGYEELSGLLRNSLRTLGVV